MGVQALLRTVSAGQTAGAPADTNLIDSEEDTERRRGMLRSQLEEMMRRGDGAIGFLLLLFREVQKLPIEDEMLRLPLVQKLRSLGTGPDTGEVDVYQVEEDGDEDEEDEQDHHEDDFAGSTLRRIDVASD